MLHTEVFVFTCHPSHQVMVLFFVSRIVVSNYHTKLADNTDCEEASNLVCDKCPDCYVNQSKEYFYTNSRDFRLLLLFKSKLAFSGVSKTGSCSIINLPFHATMSISKRVHKETKNCVDTYEYEDYHECASVIFRIIVIGSSFVKD